MTKLTRFYATLPDERARQVAKALIDPRVEQAEFDLALNFCRKSDRNTLAAIICAAPGVPAARMKSIGNVYHRMVFPSAIDRMMMPLVNAGIRRANARPGAEADDE
jgi:hypothetical protein